MGIIQFIKKEAKSYLDVLRTVPSLLLSIFVLSIFCMNLLANKELLTNNYMALDCGFLLSWIPFLLMDILCKSFSPKYAAKVSVISLVINLGMCLIFKLICLTSGNWGQFYDNNENELINQVLNLTFGGTTYIILCSAFASLISSIINSITNYAVGELTTKMKGFLEYALRSYVSTIIGQFADNFVFATIVSRVLFGWTWRQILICSVTASLFELFCEIVFSPLGYKICKIIKKNRDLVK